MGQRDRGAADAQDVIVRHGSGAQRRVLIGDDEEVGGAVAVRTDVQRGPQGAVPARFDDAVVRQCVEPRAGQG